MGLDILPDQVVQAGIEVLRAGLQLVRKLPQGLRHGGVDHDVGAGDGVVGAHHAELKLVAGEGEGRGAVPVCGVPVEAGQHIGAQADPPLLRSGVGTVGLNGVQHGAELVPQENGDHSGRRLVCAETVVVPGGGHAQAQQSLVLVHRLDDRHQEEQKLRVLIRRVAGT